MEKLKVLDLFSGIGGFSLGLERVGMETVAFCEIEEYPRKVLNKHWPNVPIYEDVRNVTAERLRADGIGRIDVITGGFPCQDISVAGKQKGITGERSGLWGELCRIIGDIRPRYAIVENVTALISGDNGQWFGAVLGDLAEIGYDCEWHCISASELGANHHRDRVWIICYPSQQFSNGGELVTKSSRSMREIREPRGASIKDNISNSMQQRLQGSQEPRIFREGRQGWHKLIARRFCGFQVISEIEPTICGGSNGLPNYMDRLKGLGNAVVPQIPELIGRAIIYYEKELYNFGCNDENTN